MKKKIIFSMFFILMFGLATANNVNAAYTATSKTVESGASVSITVKSSEGLDSFDLECVDVGGLNYKSCSSSVSGAVVNSSGRKISYAAVDGDAKTLGTYVFTAPEVKEKQKFTVVFNVNGSTITSIVTVNHIEEETEDKNDEEDKKEENTKEEDKTTETKLSSDATLSTLGVTPKEYDFTGFKKTKTEYSVTIPNEVNSLNVAYKTSDSKAKVKITGNTNLEVGTSTIKVVVTAEDGKTTKTYKIKVTKLAAEEEKPGNIIDEEDDDVLDLALKSLEIKGIKLSPEFSSDVYSYEATIDMDNNDIKKVEIIAETNQYGAKIEITGNTNLIEGENLINIIVKSGFSDEQVVYQITLNKISKTSEVVSNDGYDGIKKEHLIIGGYIVIVVLILSFIIINKIRNKKYYEDEDEVIENDENDNKEVTNLTSKNLAEEIFNKKKKTEIQNNIDKETMQDIQKENDRIFKKNEDITTEFSENSTQANEEDPFLRELRERRKKGKH